MSHDALSRRAFVGTAATLAAAWATVAPELLNAAGDHAAQQLTNGGNAAFKVLTPTQAADIEAFTSHIIPTDDTPGAREAGVVYFVDQSLATFGAAQKADVVAGLAALNMLVAKQFRDAKSFASLTVAQQLAVIPVVEKTQQEFFGIMKFATVAGVFANPSYGGNRNKMGWKLNGFDDRGMWSAPFGYYDRPENRNG